MWCDEESDDNTDDTDFCFSPNSITPSSSVPSGINEKSKRALLNDFIQRMRPDRSTRSLLVTRSYNQLNKRSKKNFLSSTRFVINTVLEFLAGSDADQVREDLFLNKSGNLICAMICEDNNNNS